RGGEQIALAEKLFNRMNMRPWHDHSQTDLAHNGHLYIVARSNPALYEFLSEEFTGRTTVVLDRRERRGVRGGDERRRQPVDADLSTWDLALTSTAAGGNRLRPLVSSIAAPHFLLPHTAGQMRRPTAGEHGACTSCGRMRAVQDDASCACSSWGMKCASRASSEMYSYRIECFPQPAAARSLRAPIQPGIEAMNGRRCCASQAPTSSSVAWLATLKLPIWTNGPGVAPGPRCATSGPSTRVSSAKIQA